MPKQYALGDFFENKFCGGASAQGTLEYLLIFGVVIVIALITVGLFSEMFSSAASVSSTQNKIAVQTSGVFALKELSVNGDGNYFLRIQSNNPDNITITNVEVGDTNQDYTTQLFQGSESNFIVNTNDDCTNGTIITKNITITYSTRFGIVKKQILQNAQIQCENYSIPTTGTTTTITDNNYTWYFNSDSNYSHLYPDGNLFLSGGLLKIYADTITNSNNQDENQTNNNWNNANFVKQNDNNNWIPTGELDWNKEAVNTTTSGGWGELVNDFNIQVANLQGLWHFNGDLVDSIGGGTCSSSGVDVANGLWNTETYFLDGDSDVINCGNLSPMRTISFWFWTDQCIEYGSRRNIILGTRDAAVEVAGEFYFSAGLYGHMRRDFYAGSNISWDGDSGYGHVFWEVPTLCDSKWHHVVASSIDGATDSVRTFLDGVIIDSFDSTDDVVFGSGSDSLRIGETYGTSQSNLDGSVDEIAMWDIGLTNEEVKELYEAQKGQWLDTNLVAYYKFNELTPDSNVYDSARGNYGILTNEADINGIGLWDSNALTLNGIDDYVYLPDNDTWDFGTSSFSISTWFNTESSGTYQTINSYETALSGSGGWNLRVNSDNKVEFYIINTGRTAVAINSDSTINTGEWYHLVGVRDADEGELRLYLNGVEAATPVSDQSINVLGDSAARVAIGRPGSYDGQYFNGKIDEVKIYNRVLTEPQILADYNSFLSAKFVDSNIVDAGGTVDWNRIMVNSDVNYSFGKEICGVVDDSNNICSIDKFNDNLQGLWHLNGNALDSSGNGYNGSWSGSEAYGTGLWNTSAGDFDGSTDYITTSSYMANGWGAITVSAWVNPDGYTDNGGIFFSRGSHSVGLLNRTLSGFRKYGFYVYTSTSSSDNAFTLGEEVVYGEWKHIVFT